MHFKLLQVIFVRFFSADKICLNLNLNQQEHVSVFKIMTNKTFSLVISCPLADY